MQKSLVKSCRILYETIQGIEKKDYLNFNAQYLFRGSNFEKC